MIVEIVMWSICLAHAWAQPFTNGDAYAASKFFIGIPSDADKDAAKALDLSPFEYNDEEYRNLVRPKPGAVYENIGFVKGDGNQFSVNGKPYYCSGTNAFYAGLEYIMSSNEVVAMMREQKKQGASILRLFTSFFDSVPERYGVFAQIFNCNSLMHVVYGFRRNFVLHTQI